MALRCQTHGRFRLNGRTQHIAGRDMGQIVAIANANRLSALAQTMVQCATYQLIPEVEEAGCAPAPQPTALLCEALEAEGLDYQEDTHSILPKYSVLTPYPFRGACDICYLRKECPKANGQGGGITSFELGGHQ